MPSRQVNNRKILSIISNIIEQYPDWRFQQILTNLNLVTVGRDRFYEEPDDTLKMIPDCYGK
jgi:hypothetical protein